MIVKCEFFSCNFLRLAQVMIREFDGKWRTIDRKKVWLGPGVWRESLENQAWICYKF